MRDRYDGLSFNRFLPADQALVRLLGVGRPLMDRALQESVDKQVFLTRVKGIDAPILIALVEDEVTGIRATVHRVILGVEGLNEGNPVALRDWELLLRLNAIEPLSEYAEGPSSVEAAAIGAAGAKLAEHVGLLDLSFRFPKAKPILVLLPQGQ